MSLVDAARERRARLAIDARSSADIKPRPTAVSRWSSTSLSDPLLMVRNRAKSLGLKRENPSAILLQADAAERCSWLRSQGCDAKDDRIVA